MKSIFIIGAGQIGLNQIEWAKEIGFYTIVTDRNPNAPGLKLADTQFIADGTDINKLVSFAKRNKKEYNINAIYCANDFCIIPAAHIAKELNLSAIPLKVAQKAVNKAEMKKSWSNHKDIITPRFFIVSSVKETKSAIDQIGLPVIVKPISASGGEGVSKITHINQLETAIKEALLFAPNNKILIEEFIDGEVHDANGLFWNDKFYPCGTMNRVISVFPYCVSIRGYAPSDLTEKQKGKLYDILEKATRAIGINFGPVKADFIVSKDKIYLLEISARFHGDVFTTHCVPPKNNPLKIYFDALYHGKIDQKKILSLDKNSNNIYAWSVIRAKPGRIKDIVDLSNASKIPGIQEVQLYCQKGNIIHKLINNNYIPGFVWAKSNSYQQVDQIFQKFSQKLKIIIA